MPDPSENGFIVVECQIAPNQNNKHVCVPKTWVKCKITEKRVAIAYPTEDESRIATRIKNKEPADDLWPYYIGDIKYEADSYEDAVVGFLQTVRGENSKQIEDEKSQIETVAEPKNSLKVRIVLPKPKPKSEKKKKSEKKSLKKHLKEHHNTEHTHTKNKNKKSKHKNAQQHLLKVNIPDSGYITEITTSPDSVDNQVAAELSSPFVSNCQSNGLPKSLESKMDDIIKSAPQNYVKQLPININNNNNSDSFERTLESLADVMEKDIDFTNGNFSPKDTQLLMDVQMKTNGIFEFIKRVIIGVKELYIEAHETKKTLDHIVSKYKVQRPPAPVPEEKEDDMNVQQNGNSLQEETLQDEMETEADDEVENETNADEQNYNTLIIKEENLFEEQDTEMDYRSDNEIFTDEESSTCEQPAAPPLSDVNKGKNNNNKKNTNWTLKHRHPAKGLVQLGGRDSRVYISAKGLEKAKQTSKNVKTFTRQLFREVFTEEALQTCSMTGRKPCFGRNLEVVRPALHFHARTVIFTYAMKYGRDVGWEEVRLSELVQSLRCMLQNNRRDRTNGRIIKS